MFVAVLRVDPASVETDAGAAANPLSSERGGHVYRPPRSDQLPQGSGGEVAQQRSLSIGENGSRPPSLAAQSRMPDRKGLAVKVMQTPGPEA